jgi:exosortase
LRRCGEIRTFSTVSQAALPAKNQTESRLGAPVMVLGGFLAGVVAVYCWHLWPEWIHNADLSHGIFTPFICLLLVGESRRTGPQRWLPDTGIWLLLPAGAVMAALSAFGLAGVLAASLGWEHALVDFLLAATVAGALLAGLICLSGEHIRAVPFNWISLTAAGLWLLSSPLPSGTYARLTLQLQGWVSGGVMNGLHLLGIPARQHGNIIELTRATVGVEEACSGIRSLLSCLYAGFFFAAWQVRTAVGRILLISLAPLLAIGMNFVRSLSLTLMANAGINIEGFWHDATGYAVLAVAAAVLAMLASKLGRAQRVTVAPVTPPSRTSASGRSWSVAIFAGGAAAALLLAGFFEIHSPSSSNADKADSPHAEIASLLPAESSGWKVETTSGLRQFAGVLRTTQLAERSYRKIGADGQPVEVVLYVAHWKPGQAPVSLVASHTPDACWPGSGWVTQLVADPQVVLHLDGRPLPRAEHRIFRHPEAPAAQQVWYWHVYDGRVINYRDPYSVPALVELALHYGFKREGEQYFVRLSSNRPWEQLANEPLLVQIFGNLSRVGLIQ